MMRFLFVAVSCALAGSFAQGQAPANTAQRGYTAPQAGNGQAATSTAQNQNYQRQNQQLTPAQQHQLAQQRAASQQQTVRGTPTSASPSAASATQMNTQPTAPKAPFAPLTAQQETELTQLLQAWEVQSNKVDRLECDFTRWHYDLVAAPAGVHATWAKGEIRYASPDKGMFKVNELKFFKGMQAGKPQYDVSDGQFGEYWVCNGQQLLDFDRGEKKCTIQDLPPEMQGTDIFESPLPFVFNLDANKIRERYWVRTVESPKQGMIVVEAWPKRQEDRAQYRLVQIVLDPQSFLPQALLMYAPNYNAQAAPAWDHYEFSNVKRNSIIGGLEAFLNRFIEKPDKSWTIVRERYQPPAENNVPEGNRNIQAAQAPGGPQRQ